MAKKKETIYGESFNESLLLKSKKDLPKFGFEYDSHLDEYHKTVDPLVKAEWSRSENPLNSPDELLYYSWDNKVEFLDGKSRVCKLNWKEIRFLYSNEKKPILEIHTYNGFSIHVAQDEFNLYGFGIPGIDSNESIDTYYVHTKPTFSSIHFYGNFDLYFPITFLR